MAGPVAVQTDVGDALVIYFNTNLQGIDDRFSLPLAVDFDWMAETVPDPTTFYPPNPYTMCPCAYLRMYTEDIDMGDLAGGQVFTVTYNFSVWYYRRQIPGEKHQRLLSLDLEQIRNAVLVDSMRPIMSIPYFRLESVIPAQTVMHSFQDHEFLDPNLRISTGEVPFKLVGKVTNCV